MLKVIKHLVTVGYNIKDINIEVHVIMINNSTMDYINLNIINDIVAKVFMLHIDCNNDDIHIRLVPRTPIEE